MELPKVAICIVSTDEVHNLLGVLDSLSRSVHENFAVFICENGAEAGYERSAAGLAEAGLAFKAREADRSIFELSPGGQRVMLLNPGENMGYAGGSNAGMRAALAEGGFDAFWILNPDTFPEPHALAALVARQREGSFGMVGSRLVFVASGLIQMRGGFEWSNWLSKGRRPFGYLEPRDAPADVQEIERRLQVISGASMYATRAYIDDVGLMDESFFVFCEDSDWCLRRKQHRLGYAHDSIVRHIHGSTSGSSTDKKKVSPFNLYLTARNRILLVRKLFGTAWPLSALLILLDLGRILVKGTWSGYGIALRGWWAGVRGHGGAPPQLPSRG